VYHFKARLKKNIKNLSHLENGGKAIAVKSGTNWGNAGQLRKQNENFIALRSQLYKMHKEFDAVIGHGYGTQKNKPKNKIYRNVSGQAFWTELTGDEEFYLKLIRLMGDEPQKHRPTYKAAWNAAINRFTRDFINDFCFEDGQIDWDKMVKFVSEDKKRLPKSQKKLASA
jgi:hypothetical protein